MMDVNDPLGIMGRMITIPTREGVGMVANYWDEGDMYIIRYYTFGGFEIENTETGAVYKTTKIPSDLYVPTEFIQNVVGVIIHSKHKGTCRLPVEDNAEDLSENISTE
jgi:hypothetical protein